MYFFESKQKYQHISNQNTKAKKSKLWNLREKKKLTHKGKNIFSEYCMLLLLSYVTLKNNSFNLLTKMVLLPYIILYRCWMIKCINKILTWRFFNLISREVKGKVNICMQLIIQCLFKQLLIMKSYFKIWEPVQTTLSMKSNKNYLHCSAWYRNSNGKNYKIMFV